jgi:hypothetical protein
MLTYMVNPRVSSVQLGWKVAFSIWGFGLVVSTRNICAPLPLTFMRYCDFILFWKFSFYFLCMKKFLNV